MTSSKAAVFWQHGAKQTPGEAYKPSAHTRSEQIQQELLAVRVTDSSGSQISGPAAWRVCAVKRGGADRDYRALQAQSYLYSVYRFTLTHHGAGRSIKTTAAYHGKKEICLCLLSVMSRNRRQINHLHMTVGSDTDNPLFEYWLHALLTFRLIPVFIFTHPECQSYVSPASYLLNVFL